MNKPSPLPRHDLNAHLERLRRLRQDAQPWLRDYFDSRTPAFVARAPGRLDLMGGIGDYSGSLVLEMPIAEAAFAAVQRSSTAGISVATLNADSLDAARCVTYSGDEWSQFLQNDYDAISRALRKRADENWAAYVLGPVLTLLRETKTQPPAGLKILVDSQVPEGKGVSSSAAVEVATMRAVAALLGVDIAADEIARLCQLAENRVAGAPCGIMDQMTSALGRSGELLALRCQPAIVEGFVSIPSELAVWGIDSGVRHAVSGSDYGSVRCGAFMGYRIIADAVGLRAKPSADAPDVLEINDPNWRGYLANIAPDEFRDRFEHGVPETMSGRDFLARYGGTTDRVTRVDPSRTYAVRAPTRHPIEENARVERFRSLLQTSVTNQSLNELGQLMFESHQSYSACGLGSDGTDLLVRFVKEAGQNSGLCGAKITGGGSGGTVAILGRVDAGPIVEQVAEQYHAATGRVPYVFCGSSPGAYDTPVTQAKL